MEIERKSRLHSGPRLIQPAEQRQGGGKKEMAASKIAIGVYFPAKPAHGLLVNSELRFSVAYPMEP